MTKGKIPWNPDRTAEGDQYEASVDAVTPFQSLVDGEVDDGQIIP